MRGYRSCRPRLASPEAEGIHLAASFRGSAAEAELEMDAQDQQPPSPFQRLVATLDYPVYIVTTAAQNQTSGCLIGFATQCSIHPPRFLACISKKNRTLEIARQARRPRGARRRRKGSGSRRDLRRRDGRRGGQVRSSELALRARCADTRRLRTLVRRHGFREALRSAITSASCSSRSTPSRARSPSSSRSRRRATSSPATHRDPQPVVGWAWSEKYAARPRRQERVADLPGPAGARAAARALSARAVTTERPAERSPSSTRTSSRASTDAFRSPIRKRRSAPCRERLRMRATGACSRSSRPAPTRSS